MVQHHFGKGVCVSSVFAALLAVFLVTLLLHQDSGNYERRLVTIFDRENAALQTEPIKLRIDDDPHQGFFKWMANAGLSLTETRESYIIPEHRDKLVLRLLAFCFDVLPPSVREMYAKDLDEVEGIDVRAERPLTQVEKAIKEALHGETFSQSSSLRSHAGRADESYNYFGFLPKFVGRAQPNGSTLTWQSPCWTSASAQLVKQTSNSWQLQVRGNKAVHFACSELYAFFTASGVHVGFLSTPFGRHKTYTIDASRLNKSQVWDVEALGVRVFRFHHGALETVRNLLETLLLFIPMLTKAVPPLAAKRNLDFLQKYVGISMKKRADPGELMLNASEIRSGDFLGIIRLDGLDTMLAFGMGSHTGHTVVAMWEDGQLYVAESTTNSKYWPTNGIQRTPYLEWIKQARQAGFSVVHVPLAPKYRDLFNATAANLFFHANEGLEYGYHALFSGWVDTLAHNYPCKPPYDVATEDKECLVWEHLEVLVPLVTKFIPKLEKPFLPSWNQHVTGSAFSGLSATELYQAAVEKGITLPQVPAIVEGDGVRYPSVYNNGTKAPGRAMVCDVFVCFMWKAGGLFKEINDEFNCVEQTNIDVYGLNILAAPAERPAQCKTADPTNNLCQLTGAYELRLPKMGERTMYKHMQEHCPTEPPSYMRSDSC